MQYQVISPKTDEMSYTVYVTDGTFHYICQYPARPPEEHKAIHLARAEQQFAMQKTLFNSK